MTNYIDLTTSNITDFIQALNLKLVAHPNFHNDFLITDVLLDSNPISIITKSCTEYDKSDRQQLLLEVFESCGVNKGFNLIK